MTTNYDALTLVASGDGWRRYDNGTQVFDVGCHVWTLQDQFGEARVDEFVDEGNGEGRVRVTYIASGKVLWWDMEMVRAVEDKTAYERDEEHRARTAMEKHAQAEADRRAETLPEQSQDDVILKALAKTMFRNVEQKMMEAFTQRLMPEVCDKVACEMAANLRIDEDTIYERVVEDICTDRIAESAAEQLADSIEARDLAECFDADDIAGYIECDEIAEHINMDGLASNIDMDELALRLTKNLDDDREQLQAVIEADQRRIDELEAAVSVLQDAVELLTNRQPFYVRAWRRVVSLFRKA